MFHDPARTTLTLADFLAYFTDVETERDGWAVSCPAHLDARPSLRVAYNAEAKKIALRCRVGCSTEDVLGSLGLTMAALFDVESGDLDDLRTADAGAAEIATGPRAALKHYLNRAATALEDDGVAAVRYAADRYGVSEALALELGLGYDDGTLDGGKLRLSRSRFHGTPRLVVPFYEFDGRPHGLQARALTADAEVRWSGPVNPEDSSWGRYGVLRSAEGRPEILLTEGPSDGLTAVAAGYDTVFIRGAALASSGVLADKIADGVQGRPVIVAGDADEAGATFTATVVSALSGRGVDVRRLVLPDGVNDLTDWREAEGEEFPRLFREAVEKALAETAGADDAKGKNADGEPTASRADIVKYTRLHYRFFRSDDGQPYAVKLDGTRIAMEVGDKLKRDIAYGYSEDRERQTGKLVIVRDDTMRSVMQYLVAEAERSGDVERVALRAAHVDGGRRLVVDLATGHIAEATADGWEVRVPHDKDPLFRLTRPTLPLPAPVRGGSLDVLRDLLGFGEREARWLLVRGWLAAAFFADYARPLLWISGSHGSGKTTRAKMVLNLINPAENLGKEPGKKEWDDSTSAMARFAVSYDNLTTISQAVSDWLCRLVTGVSEDRRVLYSQDEVHTVSYKRTGVATSITMPAGLASDAVERIAAVHVDRIPDGGRRSEEMILSAYEAARPELLGAVLDDVVRVLQHIDKVRTDETREWPRMADYGMVLAALDEALGLDRDEGHLAAYAGTLHDEMTERALDDPFTSGVLDVVRAHRGEEWRGTRDELLKALDDTAGWDWRENRRPDWWPTTTRSLVSQLRRNEESLRHAGVGLDLDARTKSARLVVLRKLRDLGEAAAAEPEALDLLADVLPITLHG